MYKLGPEIFITDWLSQLNHMENKDEAIHGMDVRLDAIQMSTNVLECMSIQHIQQATAEDEHLQWQKGYIITDWTESKDQVHQDIRAYWSFKDDMAVIDGIIMKGRHVPVPELLKRQTHQSHGNKKRQDS